MGIRNLQKKLLILTLLVVFLVSACARQTVDIENNCNDIKHFDAMNVLAKQYYEDVQVFIEITNPEFFPIGQAHELKIADIKSICTIESESQSQFLLRDVQSLSFLEPANAVLLWYINVDEDGQYAQVLARYELPERSFDVAEFQLERHTANWTVTDFSLLMVGFNERFEN